MKRKRPSGSLKVEADHGDHEDRRHLKSGLVVVAEDSVQPMGASAGRITTLSVLKIVDLLVIEAEGGPWHFDDAPELNSEWTDIPPLSMGSWRSKSRVAQSIL